MQRATILRHRDIVRISLGRIPMGPNALRYSERALAILRAGGVPDELAVVGQHLLLAAVNGFTLDETERLHLIAAGATVPEPGRARRSVRDDRSRRPFELLLDLFVGGLARRAEALKRG